MPLYCLKGHENPADSRFCSSCGDKLELLAGIHPGLILSDRYRIIRQLGQGGFGRTYLAADLHRFNELCVLKEFAPQVQGSNELKKAQELFQREAAALYRLKHPQLPHFREFFQTELAGISCLFLALDYIAGQTYYELLQINKQFNELEVTELLWQLLPLLSYIHSQGVIHRDISPDNIIKRNSDQLPVLIDFGGVKQVSATAVLKLTNIGSVPTRLGKQGYACEEQMLQGQVSPSSDLYALAVTALVLLTGKEPQELYDSYQGVWLWRREIKVSLQLETVLQKMLAYKSNERYQSAQEVLEALRSPAQQSESNISQMGTIVLAPSNSVSNSTPISNTQVISPPQLQLGWLRPWITRGVSVGVIALIGTSGWMVVNSLMNSVPSIPFLTNKPTTLSSLEENTHNQKFHSRRQALKIPSGFLSALVNEVFYDKHPQMQGRSLTSQPEDADLRNDWFNIAEELLDQIEQAKISTASCRKLGSYSQQHYQTWQRQVNKVQLRQQTNEKFFKMFPQQQNKQLNHKTFGQIWYALAADTVNQLQTQN